MKISVKDAPIGTLAPAYIGGHWYKTERGWKWNGPDGTGSTFPRPGGDWTGEYIVPDPEPVGWELFHDNGVFHSYHPAPYKDVAERVHRHAQFKNPIRPVYATAVTPWMPAYTAPPDVRAAAVVFGKGRFVTAATRVNGDWISDDFEISGEVTHWIPLPDPPR